MKSFSTLPISHPPIIIPVNPTSDNEKHMYSITNNESYATTARCWHSAVCDYIKDPSPPY